MEDKNKQASDAQQQWLKELLDQAPEPSPDMEQADFDVNDEQWLQELFASAELAVEQEFAQDAPPAEEAPEEAPLQEQPEAEQGDDSPAADPEIVAFLETILPPDSAGDAQPDASVPSSNDAQDDGDTAPAEQKENPDDDGPGDEDTDADAEDDDAPGKRRPKNKSAHGLLGLPHLVVTGVWLVIILMIGGFLGQWIWRGASDVLAFGREEKLVTITISEDDDLDSVIDKLHSAGLIQEPMWFRWYAQITDAMEDIGTGTYELNTLFDYRALVSHMSPNSAARVTVKVVIPEGYSCAQIFRLLEEKGVCSVEDLESASMGGDFSDYWFLEGMTQDQKYCLEGYLFPDTYEFYIAEDANQVLATLLNNFDTRFTDIMMDKLDALNDTMAQKMRENGLSESEIEARKFTIREAVIIASLIEKETTGASESYSISSVIYNRLTNPEKYPCLELKRPLIYITGRADLTEEDYALDSPYNTFLNPGLIPTPICNPSRASLDAALDPAVTENYYFAYNPATNSHHFFETEAEYLAFLEALAQTPEEDDTP